MKWPAVLKDFLFKRWDRSIFQFHGNFFSSHRRVLKNYNFNYHLLPGSKATVPGHTIAMSSYAGKWIRTYILRNICLCWYLLGDAMSLDDFYLTSSGLDWLPLRPHCLCMTRSSWGTCRLWGRSWCQSGHWLPTGWRRIQSSGWRSSRSITGIHTFSNCVRLSIAVRI